MQAACSLFIRRMRIFGPLNKRGGVYSFGYSNQHYSRESFSSQWQQVWHLCGVFSHLRYRARVRQKPCFLFEHVKIAWILMQTFFFGSHDACLICFFLYASHQSFINVNVNMINGLKCGQSYKCVCMCVYVWVGVTGAWLGTQPHLHAAHMLRDTLHRWKIRRHNH